MLNISVSETDFQKSQDVFKKRAFLPGKKIMQIQLTNRAKTFELITLENDECCLLGKEVIGREKPFSEDLVEYAVVTLAAPLQGLNSVELTQNQVRSQLMTVLPNCLFLNTMAFTITKPSLVQISRGKVKDRVFYGVKCKIYVKQSWADRNLDFTKHVRQNTDDLKKVS